jgi:hypothetical protein
VVMSPVDLKHDEEAIFHKSEEPREQRSPSHLFQLGFRSKRLRIICFILCAIFLGSMDWSSSSSTRTIFHGLISKEPTMAEVKQTRTLSNDPIPSSDADVPTDITLNWGEEEMALRNWTWGPFEPHPSLFANLASLSEVSRIFKRFSAKLRSLFHLTGGSAVEDVDN